MAETGLKRIDSTAIDCLFRNDQAVLPRFGEEKQQNSGIFLKERETVLAHIQEGDSLEESSAKRSGKDSVFCDLFLDTARILRAYRENLHPEPSNVTAQDIIPVALRPVLVNSLRNDLAFLVKERLSASKKRRRGRKGKSSREIQERYRLIILVEAQATWTLNILIRFLLYMASEYQQFIKVNLRSRRK